MNQPIPLENQISELRRELKRQKLTTLILFIGAVVAISATKVVSQNSKAPGSLTLRSLKIVGPDGKVKVILSGDPQMNRDGGAIAVLDNKENVRVGLMAVAKGGNVSILREDSEPMAIMGYDGDSGSLSLASNASKAEVNLAATKDVSGLVVNGPNGKEHIVAGADKTGGVVQLYDFNGKLKRQLP